MNPSEVVITGIGVVSPIGIGREPFWESLLAGRSGIRPLGGFDVSELPTRIGGLVPDFDPRPFVAQRKSLKLMCRDAMLGIAAARLAWQDAAIADGAVAPERVGIVLGADRIVTSLEDSLPSYLASIADGRFDFARWILVGIPQTYPLSFLKVLPNMIGSHVSITQDARGPNNTIHHGEVSSLVSVIEAARVLGRGAADVMIAGGAASEMQPYNLMANCPTRRLSRRNDDPAGAVRPFDADRDGQVWGEGAAALVLETRRHAEARGANVLAALAGWSHPCERVPLGGEIQGTAIRRALGEAIARAGLTPGEIGHLNAHGLATPRDDVIEAQAIRDVLGDVPVTALKSYFGNLGAAGGAVELAASVLALGRHRVPATLNHHRPDPRCPIRVIAGGPLETQQRAAVSLNFTWAGQAAAVVLCAAE